MSKIVKLLTAAWVGGQTRNPHEGALHLSDEDAQRLFDDEAAEDVTKDFTAAQRKEMPIVGIQANAPEAPDGPDNPHQAEAEQDGKPAPTGKRS